MEELRERERPRKRERLTSDKWACRVWDPVITNIQRSFQRKRGVKIAKTPEKKEKRRYRLNIIGSLINFQSNQVNFVLNYRIIQSNRRLQHCCCCFRLFLFRTSELFSFNYGFTLFVWIASKLIDVLLSLARSIRISCIRVIGRLMSENDFFPSQL